MSWQIAYELLLAQVLELHPDEEAAAALAAVFARVACPTCAAVRAAPCLRPGGAPREPHASRLRAYLQARGGAP